MAGNRTRNLRLNGVNPLSYVGVNPYTPPGFHLQDHAPTTEDNKGFIIGDLWLNSAGNTPPLITDVYMLLALGPNGAVWRQFGGGGGGDVATITGNAGGSVAPDGGGNINIVGNNSIGLTVSGNPGTNTLTITTTSGSSLVDSLTGDVGGAVGADVNQNINIVGGTNVTVTGNPGTNTLTIDVGSVSLLDTLTGDAGGAVGPDGGGNINILGGANVTVTGNPGTNTLTIAASGGSGDVDTLTGNTGGAVGVDGAANINVIGDTNAGFTVSGNPGTNTLTITTTTGDPFVETLTGDSGGAVNADAVNRNINIVGGTNCSVAGNPGTNTLTINVTTGTGDVDTLTGNTGGAVGVDGSANINVVGDTNAGLTVSGNPGTNTLTITTTTGNPALQTLTGDSGGAVPGDASGNIDIVGTASNITVTGNPGTNTLTINSGSAIANSFATDAGTATPAAGIIQLLGGSGVTTAGAGNIVTISSTGGGGGVSAQFLAVQTSNSAAILTPINPIELGAQTGALTEIFDNGGNFYPGGGVVGDPAVFTAPATGQYQFNIGVSVTDPNVTITFFNFYVVALITTARTYLSQCVFHKEGSNTTRYGTCVISVVADMAMNDAAIISVSVDPAVSVSWAIAGDPANVKTWFSGYRVG